jgi:uncharacterized protein (TIGR03437 family)
LVLATVLAASAQTDWRRIGNSAADVGLADAVTGPVVKVWYSADGSQLYARTAAGKTFQTLDFENWEPAPGDAPAPPQTFLREPVRRPDPGAQYFAMSASSSEVWGVGRQLFRSDDGKSWESLTSYKSESVIGPGIHGVAVSPTDPNQLAVASQTGVWRSMDGGLTWAGLNQFFPNLAVRRILATPGGVRGTRILTENLGALELPPGSTLWRAFPSPAPPGQVEADTKRDYSAKVHANVSAFAKSADGRQVYAGSDDGRIWRSLDEGGTFQMTGWSTVSHLRVERLFVDPVNPQVALAALSGEGPHVLRTFNGGVFWDPVGAASLPAVSVNAVTADHASGAVYVATDKGVYWTRFDLDTGVATTDLTWTNLSEHLPAARAVDVLLDPTGVQLYAALDGYGVFATPTPNRARGLRLVNTADFSNRPASPGSLVSALGEKVNAVSSGAVRWPVWNNLLPSGDTADSQIQVPFETVGSTVSLALETAAGRMNRDLPMLPVSPVIFVSDGVPLIYDADSGMPLEHNVAHPGQRLQVMVNGLGKVRPDWPTGVTAPEENTPVVVAKVQAYLDLSEVPVARATLAPGYVGMYLVEVQLPVVANYGAMEFHVAADGQESNQVQIVIVP